MRKIILSLSIAAMLFSCKKDRSLEIPDIINIEIETEIWRHDTYNKQHGLDSVRFSLYEADSPSPTFIGYTNSQGKINLSLKKSTSYRLTSITRTYNKPNSTEIYHYSSSSQFKSSHVSGSDVYIQKGWTMYYHYEVEGKGATNIPVIDPTNQ